MDDTQSGFDQLHYVAVDQVTTDKIKGEVSEWPPAILKADFGDETYYYNLADCHSEAKPERPTMTVIIDGEECQRIIAGYVDGLPYPQTFDEEFYHRVISSVVPTIVKVK
jgi:hypothetical protein